MNEAAALLPVAPWALAAVATVLVLALSVPPGGPRPADAGAPPAPLRFRWAAAAAAVAAAVLLVVSRVGPTGELRNPVPALVVGLGWPLLLLLPGLVGLVRPACRPAPAAVVDARPSAVAALGLAAAFALPVSAARPEGVGTVVAAYALAVVAGSVAIGRAAVADRAEVLGLIASWLVVGRSLPRWAPPRGALAVLVVVLGTAWFERYERTVRWAEAAPDRVDAVAGLAAALAVAAAGALALHLATRGRGAPGTAAAVLLPLAAGVAVACVVRRALISVQLLADQVAGPRAVDPDPLGLAGGQALALGLVVLGGGLAGAVLARRTGEETARLPGVGVLLVLTAASAWLVLQP